MLNQLFSALSLTFKKAAATPAYELVPLQALIHERTPTSDFFDNFLSNSDILFYFMTQLPHTMLYRLREVNHFFKNFIDNHLFSCLSQQLQQLSEQQFQEISYLLKHAPKFYLHYDSFIANDCLLPFCLIDLFFKRASTFMSFDHRHSISGIYHRHQQLINYNNFILYHDKGYYPTLRANDDKNEKISFIEKNLTRFDSQFLFAPDNSFLKSLLFKDNRLVEIKGLDRLTHLTTLYIMDSEITELSNLPLLLKDLYLCRNHLKALPQFPAKLKRLDLSHNRFANELILGQDNFPNSLQKLNISHNLLTSLQINLAQLSRLSEIDCDCNQLTVLEDNYHHLLRKYERYVEDGLVRNAQACLATQRPPARLQ